MIDITLIKRAFRKLLTYVYFDKSDMRLRYNVASFTKRLSNKQIENEVFNNILDVAIGKSEKLLEEWLSQMTLLYYPKKIREQATEKDPHLISNKVNGTAVVDRLLIKTNIPAELLILDVVWLLEYGFLIDSSLASCCYGNRMDLMPGELGVRKGNALFKKYHNQYQSWWKRGLSIANTTLKKEEDITIINFDIADCYHSIDFDFTTFKEDFSKKHPTKDIYNSPLTNVIEKIYNRYWELSQKSDAETFINENNGKHPLSLGLLSSSVLANWYLSPLDDFIKENSERYSLLYYGRYVDDCMVVLKTKSNSNKHEESISQEMPDCFKWENDIVLFGFIDNSNDIAYNRLSNFRIQKEKLYIYRFDCQLSQESIEGYEQEQIERSSEFRFLTDEADDGTSTELESVTLVNTLDAEEEAGRRFNILEENKYKLSVYFAKLNNRLAFYGEESKYNVEVEKVFKYFDKYLLIKHYLLWEKMFTTFVLSGKINYLKEYEERIRDQIGRIETKDNLFVNSKSQGLSNIKETLLFHLEQCKVMAMSLVKGENTISSLYLDTYMIRMNYNIYPMQEFAKDYKKLGVRIPLSKLKYGKKCWKYKWIPYYVKYYDIVCALSLGKSFNPDIYKDAYHAYWSLNVDIEHDNEWMAFFYKSKKDERECEVTTSYFEEEPPESLLVNIVGMDIKDEDPLKRLSKPNSRDRINLMKSILDGITKIEKTDLFILPELSLPMSELREYCRYSSKNELAFVAGLEYYQYKRKIYNYIITCLPVILYGEKDAVPIIRLKNDYAPIEIEKIGTKKVPQNDKRWQILYHWKGHVFTTYYCFELTNVLERSHFFAKIDAIYCPVFNRDTYYFNNIAESCSRDMHCYFTLSNVSHYGDSRVTQPSKHEDMNILKVKGGNTDENKAIVLSAKLNIKSLREFQKLPLDKQQKIKTFKCTPPCYPKDEVNNRKNRIVLSTNDIFDLDFDAFISNMIAMSKRFYY